MAKNNKKIKPSKIEAKIGNIDISKATQLQDTGGTNQLSPVFSFKHTDNNRYLLQDWQSDELMKLIETFKTMEVLTWVDLMRHKGLGCKPVDPRDFPNELPEMISPDVTVMEVRVSKRSRLFGYRLRNVFHIIWFDRKHDVYSMS